MPFVIFFSGYMTSLIPSYNRARKFVSEDPNAKRTGRALSIPLAAIYPLLQEFVVVYRELMLLAMVNAFGWASSPPHLACCATTMPAKVLYITLSITPSISTSWKHFVTQPPTDGIVCIKQKISNSSKAMTAMSHNIKTVKAVLESACVY